MGKGGGRDAYSKLVLMGSGHFQVFRVEMAIAWPEIFCSTHCSIHFAQYFSDWLAFFYIFILLFPFFLACLEALRGVRQAQESWHFNSVAPLNGGAKTVLPSSML